MSTTNPEDLLRETLHAKAGAATSDLSFDEIRRSASKQQRRSGRTALLVAAAVVVAVGAPTAFLLRPGDETPGPTKPPSPPATSSAPSPASSPAPRFLQRLPRSPAPGVTYLFGTTVHFASGGTAVLPQAADVSAFAVYHGGWLLGSAVMPGVQWYDNTGTLEQSGVGAYQLAASADGMRVAYRMGKEIRIGIASGMGEGEQRIPVGKSVGGWPVGFLSGGTLVYMAGDHVRADQAMTTPFPSSMALADAVSVNDVVAGEDSQQRGMAWSARTGKTLWSDSKWVVSAFSADGRYAAASAQPSAGGSEVAILDTQTGDVIAQHSLRDDEATVGGGGMAFDRDDSLLMVAVNSKEDRAVLRLTTAGTLTRATPVLAFDIRHDPVGIVFATGP